MDDKIEYFVQITTAVQVPGGVSYRSFVGLVYLNIFYSGAEDRFWDAVNEAEKEMTRYDNSPGLGFHDGASLIFYRAVPNE